MVQSVIRGFKKTPKDSLEAQTRSFHLLAIGINDYQDTINWPKLNNAVKDSEDLVAILQKRFGLQKSNSIHLRDEDATRIKILETLENYEKTLTANDNLIIYFSGHGTMDEKKTRGFWVPVEAKDKYHQLIPHSTILDHLKGINAHHIYIIADACFSGAMALRSSFGQRGKDNQPSRRVFTSGEEEPVYDGTPGGNSPFTHEVITFLENHDENFLCSVMENQVIKNMTGSKPVRNVLLNKKYIKGEWFFKPEDTHTKRMLKAWKNAQKVDSEKSYYKFMELYPKSEFYETAKKKMIYAGERKIWNIAKKKNTISTLDEFIRNNPDSPFINEAKLALNKILASNPELQKTFRRDKEHPNKPHKEIKIVSDRLGPIEMIPIEGGRFLMGSIDGENDEKPAHHVTLDNFEIGKFPVTQSLWLDVMGNNPSAFDFSLSNPVEKVSWNDIQIFLKRLNQYSENYKYRLPSEAEWEFAAKGGLKSKKFKYSGSNQLDQIAWYWSNAKEKTHPVGKKDPNELGIYDMSGNVWEWCQDIYDSDFYKNSPKRNPIGPKNGEFHVLRGGSWNSSGSDCRNTFRYSWRPNSEFSYVGFRLARSLRK